MNQGMLYRVVFVISDTKSKENSMLSSIDLFLRALTQSDALGAGCFGLGLKSRRALRDLGDKRFDYEITLDVERPAQVPLGGESDFVRLRDWMNSARTILVGRAEIGSQAVPKILELWNDSAEREGLTTSLIYSLPPQTQLKTIVTDMANAATAMGGMGNIDMFFTP